jgi:Zn-dependent protease
MDSELDQQVNKLRRIDMLVRWSLILLLWLTIGAWSCWQMRSSIQQLNEYFSLTGLRYSLFFNLWGGGAGLILCFSLTLSSLLWQLGHSLWKVSPRERQLLEARVRQIQNQGSKHPYWRWIK